MTPKARAPLETLRKFAPGTPLRDAVELIFQQNTGALIVVGSDDQVHRLCSGGFEFTGAQFTAQKIAELAKMDGGIVVDDVKRAIVRANVHFIPDPSLPTEETGTRFRTADRLAQQTGLPALAVSEEGRSVAVVFTGQERFVLEAPTALFAEANQRLQSLERLRRQLDEAVERLTRYEIEDVVTIRDVVKVIQRAALILRLMDDLELIAVELGDEAPLIRLQAADLAEGVAGLIESLNIDYQRRKPRRGTTVIPKLDALGDADLYHSTRVASALGLPPLDQEVHSRGARTLGVVPRLPDSVRDALIKRFGSYKRLQEATVEELDDVEGVGPARAKTIRRYLDHLEAVPVTPAFED
jgi:diadenylate cyclase